jgi:uncharacterized membrane protein YjjP (DUF1212 family)
MNWQKLLSGQWIITVLTCLTYCLVVIVTTAYYIRHATPDKLEGFAMGLVMGFSSLAGIVYKSYFERSRPTGGTDAK